MINQAVVPTKRDVLCGRGINCYKHEGNQHFRVVIATQLPKYTDPKTLRKEKTAIVQLIIEEQERDNRRFIREGIEGWYVLNRDESKKKVGHALRDAISETRRSLSRKQDSTCRDSKKKIVPSKISPTASDSYSVKTLCLSMHPSPERITYEDKNDIFDFSDCFSVTSFSDCHSLCSDTDEDGTDLPECFNLRDALIGASISSNRVESGPEDSELVNNLMTIVNESIALDSIIDDNCS
mmetsp:Transcript_18748/g.27717  ORF Transcript_18748/g.27717 Transcript_18748/m.27717 type:complete len:238 (-) Transcript_18748:106-819(-)|eukprot:CAMPEP_0194219444 /NCGR_PEP_ID=MMETSP0156-20130528/25976_1 /TAXON_ID=33649 /ORGANISM="Thalassionema nitzschioides, Strain L26-B" /LENGTH=237 /DNA_ID=CAMNT_0038949109 /DNA_START=346 /DNA_END=1062 /DNA_ORIENTATION=-